MPEKSEERREKKEGILQMCDICEAREAIFRAKDLPASHVYFAKSEFRNILNAFLRMEARIKELETLLKH